MISGLMKPNHPPDGCDSLSPQLQQEKINEVRRLIGPQSGKLGLYCSDSSISRYLRARNWNVKKAVKMLNSSLKWRLEFKPEEIRWDDVAVEAETGKVYRSNYKDKYGRPVIVIRPRCQNSKSITGQMKYLVYCMENAIMDLPEGQEKMIWLIDFHGFSLSNISVKLTRETAHILQEHYPERLGVAILYDPPKIFEPFWMVAKPFLEPKTANKVKFAYSDDPNSNKIMHELFDMDVVESAFGGKDSADFDITKYAERMKEDDKRISTFWKEEPLPALIASPTSGNINSDLDSEKSEVQRAKCSSPGEDEEEEEDGILINGSVPVKTS